MLTNFHPPGPRPAHLMVAGFLGARLQTFLTIQCGDQHNNGITNFMKTNIAVISKITGNCMGTTDIYLKGPKMRLEQSFIVYPISAGDQAKVITIQSDTRLGKIDLTTCKGNYTPSHPNGAYFPHYTMAQINNTLVTFEISPEDINRIKLQIFGTTDQHAGSNGVVFSDNSGAVNVL